MENYLNWIKGHWVCTKWRDKSYVFVDDFSLRDAVVSLTESARKYTRDGFRDDYEKI